MTHSAISNTTKSCIFAVFFTITLNESVSADSLRCDQFRLTTQFPTYSQNQNNFANVDYKTAISICLEEFANDENPDAALNLALLYYGSYDFKRSVAYLLKADIVASNDALFLETILLPTSYYARATNESDVTFLLTKSLKQLASLMSAEYAPARFANAQHVLGSYQSGPQVDAALENLIELSDAGITDAANVLGVFSDRTGNASDVALRALKEGAEQGNPRSQRHYASMLASTNGDFRAASHWYEQAAQQGDLISRYNLLIYHQLQDKDQFNSAEYRLLLDQIESTGRGRVSPPKPAEEIQSEEYYQRVRKNRASDFLDLNLTGNPIFGADEKRQSIEIARERLMLALLIESNEIRREENSSQFLNGGGYYLSQLRHSQNFEIAKMAKDISEQRNQVVASSINRMFEEKCRRDPTMDSCRQIISSDEAIIAFGIGLAILAALVATSSSSTQGTGSGYEHPGYIGFVDNNPGVDMMWMDLALN